MLSNRNRVKLRSLGRRFFNRPRHCRRFAGDCLSLSEVPQNMAATVYCNTDVKTIERGLYLGVSVHVQRNDSSEPNLIVAVGDSRYVLDRRVANNIRVRLQ